MRHARFIALCALVSLACAGLAFAEQTEAERRRDVIRYGLESEVTELIDAVRAEKTREYDADLLDLFNRTRMPALREAVLGLFASEKNDALKEFALGLLADPWDSRSDTVRATLAYVSELKIAEAAPLARKMLESEKSDYRDAVISTLGKIGSAEDASYLIEYLDGEIPGDEKQRLIVRQNVMAALGELKAVETWDRLAEIARDPDENAMIRAQAAQAVGKMGKAEAIPVFQKLYTETDPVLRAAAINGAGNFSTEESRALVLESFRDSFWKVRLEAIAAAETQKSAEAVPYIIYRAKNDPVEAVKLRAFDALGKVNDAAANEWLVSLLSDDKTPDKTRAKAASVLAQEDFASFYPKIGETMLKCLKDDKKAWLRYEIGKTLASTPSDMTLAVAEACISHKDTTTRSIGLDLYEKNRYPSLEAAVRAIAADEKQGALQRRAKKILEK